jgi:hypothetical protein
LWHFEEKMASILVDFEDNLKRTLDEMEALQSIFGEDEELVKIEMTENTVVLEIKIHPDFILGECYLTLISTMSNKYPTHASPTFDIIPSSFIDPTVYKNYKHIFANFWADAEGEVMIYRCVQWLSEKLSLWLRARASEIKVEKSRLQLKQEQNDTAAKTENDLLVQCSKRFVHGETLTDRKSIFQAHLVQTTNVEEIPLLLRALKSDRKIASAAHNIWCYRVGNQANNDDDGETAAGKRLALLLDHSNAKNVFVVVTRWYGGIHLGPDRFRHINNVARILMVKEKIITGGEKKKKESTRSTKIHKKNQGNSRNTPKKKV